MGKEARKVGELRALKAIRENWAFILSAVASQPRDPEKGGAKSEEGFLGKKKMYPERNWGKGVELQGNIPQPEFSLIQTNEKNYQRK